MEIAKINGKIVDKGVIDKALMPNRNHNLKAVKSGAVRPRDKNGRFLPGHSSRSKHAKLKILNEEVRSLVINEVTRILQEGEKNKHYQPVLLKVMDKAMPSLKAIEVKGEQVNQLGVIVLPTKKPIDIDEVRVDDPHLTEEDE